jgi:septal ring-binding cell division protein DamX
MRYTSDLAMNERSLRDVERWKDKIEVRLDNRQVFFLFFGSALVACLLFILGVMVGKRLESRGKAVAPEIEDPLALLDKVAASPLVASEAPVKAALAPPAAATPKVAVVAPHPEPHPAARVAAAPPTPREVAPRPAIKAPAPPPAQKVAVPAQKVATPAKVAVAAPRASETAPSLAVVPPPSPAAEPPAAATTRLELPPSPPAAAPAARKPAVGAVAGEPPKGKGRFTLQLGSFPDRAEAEAFAKQFGSQPYVVPSEIPGRGLWYRVRVGDYASAKDAVAAKASFEKQHNVIAYVVGPAAGH